MKYHLSNEDKVLNYLESEMVWIDENGERYECSAAGNIVPIKNDDDIYESLPGYFIVEVTDPKGIKAQFKLTSRDETVSCGSSMFLYPGGDYDTEDAVKALQDAGIQRPDEDYAHIPEFICYGFNEGPVFKDTLMLTPYSENEDWCDMDEQEYSWKIL